MLMIYKKKMVALKRKRTDDNFPAAKIMIFQVHFEVLEIFASYIEKEFPELVVMRERSDRGPENLLNKFTPFHNSRRGITVFRKRRKTKADSPIVSISFESDADTDGPDATDMEFVTVEGKMNDNDKYKMLANMEITATCIAKQKLQHCCSEPLKQIQVFGGLIDYNNKKGRLFDLTMNFASQKSTVKVSEILPTLSGVFCYLFSKL